MARPWALPLAPGEACEKAEGSGGSWCRSTPCAQGWSRVLRQSPGWMDTRTSILESPASPLWSCLRVHPRGSGPAGREARGITQPRPAACSRCAGPSLLVTSGCEDPPWPFRGAGTGLAAGLCGSGSEGVSPPELLPGLSTRGLSTPSIGSRRACRGEWALGAGLPGKQKLPWVQVLAVGGSEAVAAGHWA